MRKSKSSVATFVGAVAGERLLTRRLTFAEFRYGIEQRGRGSARRLQVVCAP